MNTTLPEPTIKVICRYCNGTGETPSTSPEGGFPCPDCEGKGWHLAPDTPWYREHSKPVVSACAECHANEWGDLNTEHMDREGACGTGCGVVIDRDSQYCGTCRDHSANIFTCETCGRQYDDWSGKWELSQTNADRAAHRPATGLDR